MTAEAKELSAGEVVRRFNRWASEQGKLGPDLWDVPAIEGSLFDIKETLASGGRLERLELRAKQLEKEAKALGLTPVEYLKYRIVSKS